jgi:hypothetical protein
MWLDSEDNDFGELLDTLPDEPHKPAPDGLARPSSEPKYEAN